MTQEDKELLLKDLSARLPYSVIVDYSHNAFDVHKGNYVKHGSKCILRCYLLDVFMSPRQNEKGEYIKPYLRPMSSMIEEDNLSLSKYVGCSIRAKYGEIYFPNIENNTLDKWDKIFDWLNKHHFDFRSLIERGLAIEVTEENNPYKC